MICLKNRTFAVSQTTIASPFSRSRVLWFAWKIVLLQYRKQHASCMHWMRRVVICLKNRTFAVSQTTIVNEDDGNKCCDLLEKSYFCSIANNNPSTTFASTTVVICLKNRTFAVSQTTWFHTLRRRIELWFAWKIVLLQYRKQHYDSKVEGALCCDLLEKSYFCSIANNLW